MIIKINDVAVNIREGSLNIDDAVGERSTASFVVKSSLGVHYQQGQKVEISDGVTLLFAGVIEKPVEKKPAGTGVLMHSISCKDQHYLADKRIVAKAYENQTAAYIVNDIITSYLDDEGITAGTIQTGPMVIEAVFNYVSASSALDALAEKAGFIWYVDYDKALYFMARSTYTAPFTLTEQHVLANSESLEQGNPKYRNKQYVKGGRDITDPLTENKKGDSATRTWTVGFPIAYEPEMTLNGTPLLASEIGIRGVETGKKYYWSKGDNTISQDESQTLLTSSNTLAITYQGEFDVVVITMDEAEITDRQTIEGNSGIVEDVSDETENTTREAAFQSANAKLQKYAAMGSRLSFRTRSPGLYAGQLLTVTLTDYGLNAVEMLIESVGISQETDITWYDVTANSGPEQLSWAKMFEVMATRGQAFVIRQNINEQQVLITLQTFSKTWESVESPNIFKEVYASDTLFPSATLLPMFATSDRVKYIELLTAGDVVLARKQITKQTGASTGIIDSMTYIVPYEGNGTIAKVRWYGGVKATITNGSGVMVDEQLYSKVKTSLEALQLDKTDTRNFIPMTGTKALTVAYWQSVDDSITALTAASA